MSKWEFLRDSKKILVSNISIHGKTSSKGNYDKIKSLQYQGRTIILKIKVFITSNVATALSVLMWLFWSLALKALYNSSWVIVKKSHTQDEAFDKCIRAANKQLKAFAPKFHLCLATALLSQQFHNKQTGLPWFATNFLDMSQLTESVSATMKNDHLMNPDTPGPSATKTAEPIVYCRYWGLFRT